MGVTIGRWLTFLKVVVASVDGRGTSGQGQNHRFKLCRNLGLAEIDDQSTAEEYISSLFAYGISGPWIGWGSEGWDGWWFECHPSITKIGLVACQ